MEMRTKVSSIGMVVLLAATAAALPQTKVPNVAGVWEMTVQSPQGDMTSEITFTQEKDVIKASMVGFQGVEMAGEGTLKENEIQWTFTISTPNGDFVLVYKGKLAGEEMSGEVEAGDFGVFPWTAQKKK
jgi:hypothetical protein